MDASKSDCVCMDASKFQTTVDAIKEQRSVPSPVCTFFEFFSNQWKPDAAFCLRAFLEHCSFVSTVPIDSSAKHLILPWHAEASLTHNIDQIKSSKNNVTCHQSYNSFPNLT